MKPECFVFGSNLAGRHGRGAALYAHKTLGYPRGQAHGFGGTYAYGIPTKDEDLKTLPLADIEKSIKTFIQFSIRHQTFRFKIPPIGCRLASHKDSDILPMFDGMPSNCFFTKDWKR